MKLITKPSKIKNLSAKAPIEFCCIYCNKNFYRPKNKYLAAIKNKSGGIKLKFCSRFCNSLAMSKKIHVQCKNCNKAIYCRKNKKSTNHFCNKSCAAIYNNKNKTKGTRRSKLEIWVELELSKSYPTLKIDYNKKDTIGSELDIYIPSLKLAIELNGIVHYEPIYGSDKLRSIQNNDQNKFQQCQQLGISLCIIDVSTLKYFKPCKAQKYLDIIYNLLATYGVSSKTT